MAEPDVVLFRRALTITVTKRGHAKGTEFRRSYRLPFAPANGLRISLGEEASFTIEDLVFHVDARTFSCRTAIECDDKHPLDDVLTYYGEIGYEVAN